MGSLGVLLPLGVFFVLYAGFRRAGESTRDSALRSAVFFASLLVAITELLSLPHLLTKTGLIVAWLIVLVLAVLYFRFFVKRAPPAADPSLDRALHLPRSLATVDVLLGILIAAVLAIIGSIAIIAPPDSWDAMEHFLPRVIFWVSNHSVAVYPTPDYAQLLKGEGAEFAVLHSYLLWGNDRLVNLVEFLSLVGVAVGVSSIASKLGAHRTGQLIAALFAVTVPEAVLESSGTMTTTVVSFWIVTACYFMLQAGERQKTRDIVAAGLAAGLAVLTQPTVSPYLPGVLLGCLLFRPTRTWTWTLKRLPLFVMLMVAVDAGQLARARQVTGSVLGHPFPAGGPRMDFSNRYITPARVAANVLRQASLQMGTPSRKLNLRIEHAVRKAIHMIGQNPDDPDASWSGLAYEVDPPGREETFAGNPVQFVLIALCFVIVPFLKTRAPDRRLLWYAVGIVCAFIAFSAMVRWQPWGSRFHLPLFMLAAAAVGVVAEKLLSRRWMMLGFAAFFFVVSLPYLLSNSTRSVLPIKGFPMIFQSRAMLYFGDQHLAIAPTYLAMTQAVRARSCGRIAIDAYLPVPEPQIGMSPRSFYVYPLLAELGIDGKTSSVHYIGVQNATRNFSYSAPVHPDCAIICLTCRASHGLKSDAAMGETLIFDDSELVFPANSK